MISLLGPLAIEGAKRSRRGLRARALELVAFLALQKEGAQRDEILEALWPGEDPKRSRPRFYQALRDARRLLGDAMASERDRYWLDRSRVRVDVDEFERLLAGAEDEEAGRRERFLAEALALVRDQPLAGLDYPWAGGEIPRLRALMTGLFERMGHLRLKEGEPAAALALAERGIELDRYNEALERVAMNAEGVLELRQAVIDRYERLCRRLDELGLEPERETRILYRQLLGQD
jgi:DNA-binding SARP family transcriptional activator